MAEARVDKAARPFGSVTESNVVPCSHACSHARDAHLCDLMRCATVGSVLNSMAYLGASSQGIAACN